MTAISRNHPFSTPYAEPSVEEENDDSSRPTKNLRRSKAKLEDKISVEELIEEPEDVHNRDAASETITTKMTKATKATTTTTTAATTAATKMTATKMTATTKATTATTATTNGTKEEDTRKNFDAVTERLWGKKETRKPRPPEPPKEKRPTDEEWMKENELMQCLKMLRGEITAPELQRRKAFYAHWDKLEGVEKPDHEKDAKNGFNFRKNKNNNNNRRGKKSMDTKAEDDKKSGSTFDRILQDIENKRGKPDPSKDKQPAVTWKMFMIMFVFYFLWGFKGVIWRYFFPSKK